MQVVGPGFAALHCSLQEAFGILSEAPRAVVKRTGGSGKRKGSRIWRNGSRCGLLSASIETRERKVFFNIKEVRIIRTRVLGATVTL